MIALTQELQKQGIKQSQIDIFKISNPNSYDSFDLQSKIDAKIAVRDYKYKIKIANKKG